MPNCFPVPNRRLNPSQILILFIPNRHQTLDTNSPLVPCEMPRQSKRTSAPAPMENPPPPGAHPAPPSAAPSMFRPGAWCPPYPPQSMAPPPLHTGFLGYSTQAWLVHHLKLLGGHMLPLQICKTPIYMFCTCQDVITGGGATGALYSVACELLMLHNLAAPFY